MPSLRDAIQVRTATRRYTVYVGDGLLARSTAWLPASRVSRLYVISSPRVKRLWGGKFRQGLARRGMRTSWLLMREGEEQKSLATVERLARALVRSGADRTAVLVALGGGVVGDVVGYLAASFMRGVDYIQVPTTLLAQIDSAIGGKTGVNLPEGKNLLGAFHHPAMVCVDLESLRSLPRREFNAGLYELIKYAVIGDPTLFRFLEGRLASVQSQERQALAYVVARGIRQKARVVGRDEREHDQRRILNLGHTFGHALEKLAGYRGLRHGEAVGWGMLMATRLAERLGHLPGAEAERIARLVRAVGGLPPLPRVRPQSVLAQLYADKKRRGDTLFFVLPERVGRVRVTSDVPRRALLRTVEEFLTHSRR